MARIANSHKVTTYSHLVSSLAKQEREKKKKKERSTRLVTSLEHSSIVVGWFEFLDLFLRRLIPLLRPFAGYHQLVLSVSIRIGMGMGMGMGMGISSTP
jgi:hypothetical protein